MIEAYMIEDAYKDLEMDTPYELTGMKVKGNDLYYLFLNGGKRRYLSSSFRLYENGQRVFMTEAYEYFKNKRIGN